MIGRENSKWLRPVSHGRCWVRFHIWGSGAIQRSTDAWWFVLRASLTAPGHPWNLSLHWCIDVQADREVSSGGFEVETCWQQSMSLFTVLVLQCQKTEVQRDILYTSFSFTSSRSKAKEALRESHYVRFSRQQVCNERKIRPLCLTQFWQPHTDNDWLQESKQHFSKLDVSV